MYIHKCVKYFSLFLKEDFYTHQGCIHLIKSTVKAVILWIMITIKFLNIFLIESSASLQVTVFIQ